MELKKDDIDKKYKAFQKDIRDFNNFSEKIKNLFLYAIDNIFEDILTTNEADFISSIQNGVEMQLTDIYSDYYLNDKTYLKIFEQNINNAKNYYKKNYNIIKNAKNFYESLIFNNTNLEPYYLIRYRKHCCESPMCAHHSCERRKPNEFLIITENMEELNEKKEILFVYCYFCNKVYKSTYFYAYCIICNISYYSNILRKDENPNLLPATWSKYHCEQIINDKMKCIKCKKILYLNLKTKMLECLNKNCGFESKPSRILWTCINCKTEFKSDAIVFNPLELENIKKVVRHTLQTKHKAHPNRMPCCKINTFFTPFYHKKDCPGILYVGDFNNKMIIVCEKCKAINFYDRFIWTCPKCGTRFRDKKSHHKEPFLLKFDSKKNKNAENEENNSLLKSQDYNLSDNIISSPQNEDSKSKSLRVNIRKYASIDEKNNDHIKKKFDDLKNDNNKNVLSISLSNKKNLKDKMLTQYSTEKTNENLSDKKNRFMSTKSPDIRYTNNYLKKNIFMNDYIFTKNQTEDEKKEKEKKEREMQKILEKKEQERQKREKEREERERRLIEEKKRREEREKKEREERERRERERERERERKEREREREREREEREREREREERERERERERRERERERERKEREKEEKERKEREKEKREKEERERKERERRERERKEREKREREREEKERREKEEHYKKTESKSISSVKTSENSENNSNKKNSKDKYHINDNNNIKNNSPLKKYNDNNNNNNTNKIKVDLVEEEEEDEINELNNGIINFGSGLQADKIKEEIKNILAQGDIPEFEVEDYTLYKQLGEGSYGVIYSVYSNKDHSKKFAMKKIIAHDLDELDGFHQEFEFVASCNHPNIMKIFGVCVRFLDVTTFALYVLMEMAINDWDKEIKEHLKIHKLYKEDELIFILKQLTSALKFMQVNKKIAHRDIKPQNILIFETNNKYNDYKVADFGEAKEVKISKQLNTLRGTELYMSPALYNGLKDELDDVTHNPYKSDVFSLGFCFIYAACLNFNIIYELRDIKEMNKIEKILHKNLKNKYTEKFIKVLALMLEIDENKRVDFEGLENYLNENFNDEETE